VQDKFSVHSGEMGTRWRIHGTIAQVHALLYISPEPLPAETISQVLSVARSNVSNSLRELQGWGIIRVQHILGDRRDHYESMKDVWEMCQIILDERKKREIDPTVALLRECIAEAQKNPQDDPMTISRLQEMLGFFETMSSWYVQIRKLPTNATIKFIKMGSKVRKLLGTSA